MPGNKATLLTSQQMMRACSTCARPAMVLGSLEMLRAPAMSVLLRVCRAGSGPRMGTGWRWMRLG